MPEIFCEICRTKLTQQQLADAMAKLQAGEPIVVVAKCAGVSVPTLYRYRAAYRR